MLLHRRQAAAMDALLVVVLKVCSGAAGFATLRESEAHLAFQLSAEHTHAAA
jgi:hypothetical protein